MNLPLRINSIATSYKILDIIKRFGKTAGVAKLKFPFQKSNNPCNIIILRIHKV